MIGPRKLRQHRLDLLARDVDRRALSMASPSVSPVLVRDAEVDRGLVGLVGFQQVLRKLGRFAEAQRQQAGGERVERAGVAGLFRVEQALGLDQRVVATTGRPACRAAARRRPGRAAFYAACVRSLSTSVSAAASTSARHPARAWRWPGRSAATFPMPRAVDVSCTKCSSGRVWMCRRLPSWLRMKPAALAKPCDRVLDRFLVVVQHGEEHLGMRIVRRELHFGDA